MGSFVALVIVVAVGVIAIGKATQQTGPTGETPCSAGVVAAVAPPSEQAAPPDVLTAITAPSAAVLAAVGTGTSINAPQPVSSTCTLKDSDGKPQITYVGADYCPYCAAQRWSMVVALSRFGTFTNLHLTTSSSSDVYPDTHTLSFYGSSYSSQYVSFLAVEESDRNQQKRQTPTAEQQQLMNVYDTSGGIPFLDIGNRYVAISAGFDPTVLKDLTWQQIAAQLSDAHSAQAQAILGNANAITASICTITDDKPASVCTAAPIPQIEAQLGTSGH